MSFVHRMLSRVSLTAASTALAFQLLTPSAYALDKAGAEEALKQIHQATISSYYSVNGFYNFTANQGDQKHLTAINDSVAKINELVSALEGSLNSGATSEALKSALEGWKAYQGILNENIEVIVNEGYPDLALAGDMATKNIQLNSALNGLYKTVVNSSDVSAEDFSQAAHEAANTIALMMTKYSARTTSTISQAYTGGEAEITIDALAKQFDAQLKKLTEMSAQNDKASDMIDSATTKWEFIENSYLNYNENRVNFIVNLYTKKIINDIESAEGSLN